MSDLELNDPQLYFNRELSLLAFHRRVFEQARDETHPLLERLRFLCITSSNLDEYFEVRVAGLKQQALYKADVVTADGRTPREALQQISDEAHRLVEEQYTCMNEVILPALEGNGIRFLRRNQLSEKQERWMRNYFETQLLPILTPIRLDPAHPFPRILNKSLNFIVQLEGRDAFGRLGGMAVVQAPRALPRFVRLPDEAAEAPYDFVFLSSIIHAHVNDLFPGMNVLGCYQFRVTRNSDLFVNTDEADDLLAVLEGELPSRRYGEGVRLEVADNCPEDVAAFLLDEFGVGQADLFQVNGPVNLHRLIGLPEMIDRPDLKYPSFKPGLPKGIRKGANLFRAIKRGDILLHHPYHSFAPVVDLIRQAATDPDVLAIKQTLYRTGTDSVLVEVLTQAARLGKEVTVVVELRARFDEAANIELANRLQEAGAHVVYGVVGYKTHAKMLMIVRRESGEMRRYVHMGTGNYHPGTSRIYSDYGLMTCDVAIGEDVHQMFMQLTSLGRGKKLNKMLQSPFTLHGGIVQRIQREAENARAGKAARIIVKVNALVEEQIIQALYDASRAGVKIDLIVRGICCLKPGVAGVSENIRVISIVGRFLEHSRVFWFANDGPFEVWCSSADWMPRNLFARVEECFPIEDPDHRTRISRDLELFLNDNTRAWELQSDGSYVHRTPGDAEPISVQDTLLAKLADG
ncbi:MAG: polyphosphate kinase 1 [Gammaproteobacteria bacterium]|nr:polyphosphate kinase 1 [Gammaproteobacteria bacterium]MCP5136820.1 polyphosphate kinase 1 [Gammaproteobacteria bacterium]